MVRKVINSRLEHVGYWQTKAQNAIIKIPAQKNFEESALDFL